MKYTLYATMAAGISLLLSSGALVLATAAPQPTRPPDDPGRVEAALMAHIDRNIAAQLAHIKKALSTSPRPPFSP